ncbi:lasso RiPP family leader peptide-containing protein [Streptomyces hoynatensis]|uniref:Lasso RiPP family leader peptide-containing protein n=1 Tax=Streptomyces hoynatensis TaxID=1141874 RepID=A0A3A9YNJ1_9ACTN|nr:lasso RiPP family leader peptide-containing protein [Streptomyces hoynatensis]
MSEERAVEAQREVYAPPMLTEAGSFSDKTQGDDNLGLAEGNGAYWCGACG